MKKRLINLSSVLFVTFLAYKGVRMFNDRKLKEELR